MELYGPLGTGPRLGSGKTVQSLKINDGSLKKMCFVPKKKLIFIHQRRHFLTLQCLDIVF